MGNRETMTDATGTSTYEYNENNWLLSVEKDGKTQVSYVYDEIGNIISVTDRQGNTTEYTYDRSSRMETVSFEGRTAAYEYDENGNRKSIDYDGEAEENYTYDKNNRLLELANKKAGGSIISSYSYTYDRAGRQTSKTDSYGKTSYTYDKAGRILKVEAPGKTTAYTYDGAGNRTSQDETYTSEQTVPAVDGTGISEIKYIVKRSEYVYSNTNRLLKLSEKMKNEAGTELLQRITTFRYDGNGNELRRSVEYISLYSRENPKAYEAAVYGEETTEPIHAVVDQTASSYDGFNRLVRTEIIKATVKVTVEYAYDGDGLRTEKRVRRSDRGSTAEVTSYLYDRQHVILEERDSKDIRYVRGINYIARIEDTDKLSYFMYNGHGDVVQTVSEDGEIENQYDYDIFGNPTLTVEEYANSIRYAGEFYDAETGLYYLRARYYDPYIGRFISEDSYWGEDINPLSLNLYTYAHNDPVQHIDPTGHLAWQEKDNKLPTSEAKAAMSAAISNYDKAKAKGDKGGMAAAESEAARLRSYIKTDTNSNGGSSSGSKGGSSGKSSGGSSSKGSRNKDKVTVTWEGYIIDINISELEEYRSHGWGEFKGQAYSENMYNSSEMLDTITTSSGQKVNIENRGYIGTIITGKGSHTTISNRGEIKTIITGVGSTTTIKNTGEVTTIKTGDSHAGRRDSNTKIKNYGNIDYIETGKESENTVFNFHSGEITSLITGEGNRTAVYADNLEFVNAELQQGSIDFYDIGSLGMDNNEPSKDDHKKALEELWNIIYDQYPLSTFRHIKKNKIENVLKNYKDMINEAGNRYGVPPEIIAGIIIKEQITQSAPDIVSIADTILRKKEHTVGLGAVFPSTAKEAWLTVDPREGYINGMFGKDGDIEVKLAIDDELSIKTVAVIVNYFAQKKFDTFDTDDVSTLSMEQWKEVVGRYNAPDSNTEAQNKYSDYVYQYLEPIETLLK